MSAIVQIEPATAEARRLWQRALELAAEFGPDEPWALIGGLMVQLHAFEHGSGSRLTADIDFLGDSRRRPAMTVRMAEVLAERGAEMAMPSRGDERLGYRFEVDGTIVESSARRASAAIPRRSAGTRPSRFQAAPRLLRASR